MSDTPQRPIRDRILRAGVTVALAHGLFKLAGLIQAKAMAYYLPAQANDVVYAFAFEGCLFSLFLIGEEVIGPAGMPVFMQQIDTEGERAGWRFAGLLLSLQTLVLLVVVALLVAFPGAAVRLWTTWTPEHDAGRFALGAWSVRRLAPALLGLSLGSTTYVLLNGHKRFFLAAFGDAVWKLGAVAVLLVGIGLLGRDSVLMLVAGLVAGSLLKVATHAVGLRDKLHLLQPRLALRDPALRRMLALALPLLVGIVFAKIRDGVNVRVLSAIQTDGLLQACSLGRKLQGTIYWLVPYALAIAVFPYFCEFVDRNDRRGLADIVTTGGRMLLALFVPFAAVVAVLAVPLTSLVFAGGEFGPLGVSRTALTTACYTLALPAAALEALLMQAFFANRRMTLVTVIGMVFSTLSMAISIVGVRAHGGDERIVLLAVAGGFALTRTLKSVALVLFLRRDFPAFPGGETALFLLRVAGVAGAAGAGAWAARLGAARLAGTLHAALAGLPAALLDRLGDLAQLGCGGVAAVLAGVLACRLLRVDEPFRMIAWARRRGKSRTVAPAAAGAP